MQTFLPYSSFQLSLTVLDKRRLNKQRIEAKQIIDTIELNKTAWKNHPAVKMWRNYVPALKNYYNISVIISLGRGIKCKNELLDLKDLIWPDWLGDERLHSSHRANLLRKDYNFYSSYGWKDNILLPYWWPC